MTVSPISVGVLGVCGRMGIQIVKSIEENPLVVFSGGYDIKGNDHKFCSFEVEPLETVVSKSDVVIDFSSPEGIEDHLRVAIEQKKAMVIGTTGFQQDQKEFIKSASQKIPCLVSPNMSVGMNVLFKIVGQLAQMLGDSYDFEIIEKHHSAKKDAPGGSALELLNRILDATGRSKDTDVSYGRKGKNLQKKHKEIGVHAVRAGGIVGEHTVLYAGKSDFIEITHKVQNRKTFADGAVQGAIFLYDKDSGLYSLLDMLRTLH